MLQVVRDAHVKMYPLCAKITLIHTLNTGQHVTLLRVEKHTLPRVFVYGDGFKW